MLFRWRGSTPPQANRSRKHLTCWLVWWTDWSNSMDKQSLSSTRSELMAEFEQEWVNIEHLCAGKSQADMVAPGVEGEWSVKDILCHLSAWEKYLLDRLGMVMTGQPPQYPAMTSWDDGHRFNATVYADNKDRWLSSVGLEFRTLYRGVMTVLEALSVDKLS